ncbi:hypothetical protein BHE74_00039484 [Ensete ventricosum]|nr:hypothetical protein GW17_00039434 [Ensete ventricosum]RWW53966.1 hypothetical protein BHE74_00039484 [Ensete ventricosum]
MVSKILSRDQLNYRHDIIHPFCHGSWIALGGVKKRDKKDRTGERERVASAAAAEDEAPWLPSFLKTEQLRFFGASASWRKGAEPPSSA